MTRARDIIELAEDEVPICTKFDIGAASCRLGCREKDLEPWDHCLYMDTFNQPYNQQECPCYLPARDTRTFPNEDLKFKRTLKSASWARPDDFKPSKSKWGIFTKDGKILGTLQHKGGDDGWDVVDAATKRSVATNQEPMGFRQAWNAAKDTFAQATVDPITHGAVLPASESLVLRKMEGDEMVTAKGFIKDFSEQVTNWANMPQNPKWANRNFLFDPIAPRPGLSIDPGTSVKVIDRTASLNFLVVEDSKGQRAVVYLADVKEIKA